MKKKEKNFHCLKVIKIGTINKDENMII